METQAVREGYWALGLVVLAAEEVFVPQTACMAGHSEVDITEF